MLLLLSRTKSAALFKARLFPRYVTFTVCPLQSCPVPMAVTYTCRYSAWLELSTAMTGLPDVLVSHSAYSKEDLFGKASSRSSPPLLPPVLNCSQSSHESASKVLFWFLNVKGLFNSTFPSSSSLQIYDLTYFLFQKCLSALISTVTSVKKQATCQVLVSTRDIFTQS